MTATDENSLLTEVERVIKERYEKGKPTAQVLPSNAKKIPTKASERMEELTLPDDQRPKMPLTKDRYMVRENPHRVQWEREVRKFLRNLSPEHGHRVSAVMIYEWATGINVAELMANGGSANRDLRHINKILQYYFGKSYMTYIAGKKVGKAYKIRPGYYIRRHRPLSIELWVEYSQGVLYP